MRRSFAAILAVAGVFGAVGTVAAGGATADVGPGGGQPPKSTIGTVTNPPAPTVAPPPTAVPPSTVPPLPTGPTPSIVAPPSSWLTTVPPSSSIAATVPVPVTATTTFDAVGFFTDVYTQVAADPFLLDEQFDRVITGSPADAFLLHLIAVEIMKNLNGTEPTPLLTVAVEEPGVRVCAPDGTCEVFGDFVAPTGLLESFSVNGLPIDERVGAMPTQEVATESMTVDGAVAYLRSDGQLSVVLFLLGGAGATAFSWDQAVFTDAAGQPFLPDLATSSVPTSVAADDISGAHLLFPGASMEGDITVPIVGGVSGAPSTLSIPISATYT